MVPGLGKRTGPEEPGPYAPEDLDLLTLKNQAHMAPTGMARMGLKNLGLSVPEDQTMMVQKDLNHTVTVSWTLSVSLKGPTLDFMSPVDLDFLVPTMVAQKETDLMVRVDQIHTIPDLKDPDLMAPEDPNLMASEDPDLANPANMAPDLKGLAL